MNDQITALERGSHCEEFNDEAISGLINEFRDCHSPAGFAVTFFHMLYNEVVTSCIKHMRSTRTTDLPEIYN
jgi:hypothetical protein